MNAGPTAWLVSFFVLLGGSGVLLRGRILERRIVALERSLGAFADIGGGDPAGKAGELEILEHLLQINDSLLQEIRTADTSRPGSEGS